MIKEIQESDKHVRLIRKSSQQLMRVMDIQSEPGAEVQTEVAMVTHKQRNLRSSLRLRRSHLQSSLQLYGDFLECIEKVEQWLPKGKEKIGQIRAESGTLDEIQKELDELQVRLQLTFGA